MHYILISFILHTQCTRPVNTLDDVVFEQLVTCTQQTQFWCKEARALSPRHIGNGQLGTPALCVCVCYTVTIESKYNFVRLCVAACPDMVFQMPSNLGIPRS